MTHESGFQSDTHFYIIKVLADCSRTQEHCLPVYKVLQVLSNTPPSSPPPPAKSNACNKLMQQFLGQLSPFSKQDFFFFWRFSPSWTHQFVSFQPDPRTCTPSSFVYCYLVFTHLHTNGNVQKSKMHSTYRQTAETVNWGQTVLLLWSICASYTATNHPQVYCKVSVFPQKGLILPCIKAKLLLVLQLALLLVLQFW